MRGVVSLPPLLLSLLLTLSPVSTNSLSPLFASGYEISVKTETVKDLANYNDESPSLLVRNSFSVNMENSFIFNFNHQINIEDDSHNYTWNAGLYGANSCADFLAGNFNLRFGTGLIMGKQKFTSSDLFTRSLSVTSERPVIPAAGTNPANTFFGAVMKISYGGEEFSAGGIPFYSLQRRFVTETELSGGYLEASLPTITGRTTEDSKYNESVDILNYGGMLYLSWLQNIMLQVYGFSTEIRNSISGTIEWEFDVHSGNGLKRYSAYGLFIEYRDEVISLYLEPALSLREYQQMVTGRALMWGIGIKNRIFILSVKGKNCEPDFRSEYSSTNRHPENVFEIKTGIRPCKKLDFGALFYSEKNLNPSYGRDFTTGSIREEVYAEAKPFLRVDLLLKAARVRSCSDDLAEEKRKVSAAAVFSLPADFYIRTKFDYQREAASESSVSACEVKYLFLRHFTLSAGYTEIRADKGSGIYAAVIPAPSAEMSTSLYTEPARGGAIKLKYGRRDLSFHARGSLIQTGEEREITAESSLSFVF